MPLKYTTQTQDKLENLLKEAGYAVRYEKGEFQAGYCIVKDKKVVVINKYFTVESKINSLSDIILQLEPDEHQLSEPSQKMLRQVQKTQSEK